jgi:hypothetical protein
MTPSIATKFQYVNSSFIFLLTTCFGPYGPSSGEIYNYMFSRTILTTTDPLYVHNLTSAYIGTSTYKFVKTGF